VNAKSVATAMLIAAVTVFIIGSVKPLNAAFLTPRVG
jgi:hypothetical protein